MTEELETEIRHLKRELLLTQQDRELLDKNDTFNLIYTPTKDPYLIALETAKAEWESVIREPTHNSPNASARIDNYIRGSQGLNWNWERGYTTNGQFAWCGAFMAHCFGAAGLKVNIRSHACASTYRLYQYIVNKRSIRSLSASSVNRIVDVENVKPGDVLIVGKKDSQYGDHITIVREVPVNGQIATYEGNAKGPLGDSTIGEGVIKRVRVMTSDDPNIYRAKWAFRWDPSDFE